MALTTESALRKDKRNAAGDLNGTLQHRHFAVIAGIIADVEEPSIREMMAVRFASALRGTNPRFDRQRFMRACGVKVD
jgi:hypothetical protein